MSDPDFGSRPPTSTALLAAAAAVVALVCLGSATTARASRNTLSLHLGGMLANANGASSSGAQFGAAGRGSVVFDLHDFWSVEFGGGLAHHFRAKPGDTQLDPFGVRHLFAGFRYNIDVFQYVPYLGLSVAAYLPGPPPIPDASPRTTVGAILTAGVEWRFDRNWSVGVVADLHAVSFGAGSFPNYSTVGIQFGHHFRL